VNLEEKAMPDQSIKTLKDFHSYLVEKHKPAFVPNFEHRNGDETATMLFIFEKP